MTKQEFNNLTAEFVAKGYSPKLAEKKARTIRKMRSSQHKAAMARRLAMADARFERTGNFNF